jgi:hypothetical protein
VKKKFEKRKQNPPKIKIKIKMRVGKYSREKREKDGRAAAAQVFIQLEQFFSYVCVCGSRRNIIHHQTHTHTHSCWLQPNGGKPKLQLHARTSAQLLLFVYTTDVNRKTRRGLITRWLKSIHESLISLVF